MADNRPTGGGGVGLTYEWSDRIICGDLERHGGEDDVPPHLSKDQDIIVGPDDQIAVCTLGGGGFGEPFERDAEAVTYEVGCGSDTIDDARERFGVVLEEPSLTVDAAATRSFRESRHRRAAE